MNLNPNSSARATAVIVAGGAGLRLGGEPKQFRPLGGRPLLAWSCARFRTHPGIDGLVVVVPAEFASDPPAWLREFEPTVVAGGATRQESVRLGLNAAGAAGVGATGAASMGAAGSAKDEIVLIHDAARPFASAALVTSLLEAAASGPVIPVLELADAIKRVVAWPDAPDAPGLGAAVRIEATLDRTLLRAAQTPQAFPLELIRRLHARAAGAAGAPRAPDDATLCEAAGIPVRWVPGERHALKITRAEDLAFAEWLVETGRVAWPGEA